MSSEQLSTLAVPAAAPPSFAALRHLARAVGRRLLPWLVPLALVVAWQVSSSAGWLSSRVLPAPFDVLRSAW